MTAGSWQRVDDDAALSLNFVVLTVASCATAFRNSTVVVFRNDVIADMERLKPSTVDGLLHFALHG